MKIKVTLLALCLLCSARATPVGEANGEVRVPLRFSSLWNFSKLLADHGVKLPVTGRDITDLTVRVEPGPILKPDFEAAPVPEGSAGAIIIAAIGLVGLMRRRR